VFGLSLFLQREKYIFLCFLGCVWQTHCQTRLNKFLTVFFTKFFLFCQKKLSFFNLIYVFFLRIILHFFSLSHIFTLLYLIFGIVTYKREAFLALNKLVFFYKKKHTKRNNKNFSLKNTFKYF
jgi:hypothetical protein